MGSAVIGCLLSAALGFLPAATGQARANDAIMAERALDTVSSDCPREPSAAAINPLTIECWSKLKPMPGAPPNYGEKNTPAELEALRSAGDELLRQLEPWCGANVKPKVGSDDACAEIVYVIDKSRQHVGLRTAVACVGPCTIVIKLYRVTYDPANIRNSRIVGVNHNGTDQVWQVGSGSEPWLLLKDLRMTSTYKVASNRRSGINTENGAVIHPEGNYIFHPKLIMGETKLTGCLLQA